jgi:hypothetical protein
VCSSAHAQNLGAPTRTSTSPAAAVIRVGERVQHLRPGDAVTPAELAALNQVLTSGRQGLLLNHLGTAIGGTLNLNASAAQSTAQLSIPHNVTVLTNFSASNLFSVTGNITNFGTLYAYSTSALNTSGTFAADNILNDSGALISSVVPRTLVTNAIPRFDLRLRANDGITNYGTITSSGNLDLYSASGTITNSGTVASESGSINIGSGGGQPLKIQNSGGTFEALLGSINIQNAGGIDFRGGNLIANTVNLCGGSGSADVNADSITGTVNTSGDAAHVTSHNGLLTLGDINVTGDPTYYNKGNIKITGNISVGEDLAIIAGGNVTTAAGVTSITARDTRTGWGHNITIIAGANISETCGNCSTNARAGSEATGPITVEMDSPKGGNIDFSASPRLLIDTASKSVPVLPPAPPTISTDGNGNVVIITGGSLVTSLLNTPSGGNVTLAAFANHAVGGRIHLASTNVIDVSGIPPTSRSWWFGGGINGTITLIAGAKTGQAISIGQGLHVVAQGAYGSLVISASQPTTSNGNPITFSRTGWITSNNRLIPSRYVPYESVPSTHHFRNQQMEGPMLLCCRPPDPNEIVLAPYANWHQETKILNDLTRSSSAFTVQLHTAPSLIAVPYITASAPPTDAAIFSAAFVAVNGPSTRGTTHGGDTAVQIEAANQPSFHLSALQELTSLLPQNSTRVILSTDQTHMVPVAFAGPTLNQVAPAPNSIPPTGDIQLVFEPNQSTNLEHGSILIAPHTTTQIKTRFGNVVVNAGAVALINVDDDSVAIYNLAGNRSDDLVVDVGSNEVSLHSGQQLLLTNKGKGSTESQSHLQIPLRKTAQIDAGDGINATLAEFSLPAVLGTKKIYSLLSQSTDSNAKETLSKIMKSAVSLQLVTANRGPYRN